MSFIPNLKYKTSLCNLWKQGKIDKNIGLVCEKGFFCFFAHGNEELRTMQQNRQYSIPESLSQPQHLNRFKTIYCKFYAKGNCKLGESCSFAHSKDEKRQKMYVAKDQMISSPYIPSYQYYYPTAQIPYQYQMHSSYQPECNNIQIEGLVENSQNKKSQKEPQNVGKSQISDERPKNEQKNEDWHKN